MQTTVSPVTPRNWRKEFDDDAESVITDQRYVYIQKVIEETVKKPAQKMSLSDKIDSIVTNRLLGIPIFVLVMWAGLLCIRYYRGYIRNRLDQ